MTIRVYLDNNATTRPHPAVIAAMRRYEEELYLNASSLAGELLGAARPMAAARREMIELLGANDDDQIVLTSGATEANAWVFHASPSDGHIVTSQIEHSSIIAAVASSRREGRTVDVLRVSPDGIIRREDLTASLRPDTKLVSLQLANNETGAIQPLPELIQIVRSFAPDALIHTDATQALGRIPIDLANNLGEIDLLSFSGHKFHGPKGVGGLFLRSGVRLAPLIGGEQEAGQRGGTSNVPAAAGLAEAARKAVWNIQRMPNVAALRDFLESSIQKMRPDAVINAQGARRLPNTSSITVPGIDAEEVIEMLALQGICIANGSACTAGATAPSHVLTAMGLTAADSQSTFRFSLSIDTSADDIGELLSAIAPLLDTHPANKRLAVPN